LDKNGNGVKEPGGGLNWKVIFHMLLFGFLLAAVVLVIRGTPGEEENKKVIVVTGADAAQVHAKFMRTWNRLPTDEELRKGIEQYIKDEVLYREAIARNLDESDPTVRMAMVRKITMMGIAQTDASSLSNEDIEAYFSLRKERYEIPALVDLQQVFLNRDVRGVNIFTDAQQLLEELSLKNPSPDDLADYGDLSMINIIYNGIDERTLDRTFGTGFGSRVVDLPVGEWAGPVESAYGLHIVKITNRTESRIPELKEVLSRVITDMSYENNKAAEDQFYSELVPLYKVVYDESAMQALEGESN
jgi:peptidyl-prolyl cis-trans isomerase C